MNQELLSACDLEPIHLPSAIQEFGALAVLDVKTLQVVQVSANSQKIFGLAPEAMLGKGVRALFGEDLIKALSEKGKRVSHSTWLANVTYQENLILIEAEPAVKNFHQKLEADALDAIQNANSLADLLDTTAKQVAKIANLDRVMIYRFHEDLHGEVVAEAVKSGVESYWGLHYPASDVPLPARAVFLKNWVRMIPQVNYSPVPLTPKNNPVTGAPLDLGISLLRAVSPVHIEYLTNMQVGASLTISLMVDGKLWGLIACHQLSKHYLSMDVRDACEAIGRMTSAFIAIRSEADIDSEKRKYYATHQLLVTNMHSGRDMAAELTRLTPNVMDLIESGGSAAALYLDGYWGMVGQTPPEEKLEQIVDWLREKHADSVIYATENLASEFAGAKDFSENWCGMMALSIPKTDRNYILWFRPELKTTVSWAGKPEKKEDEFGRLHPRGSFKLWQEEVSGKSSKWTPIEKDAAMELRNAIMAVDLQAQYRKEQEARIEAVRATKAREELMVVLSHDLKNPIGSIRLGAQFATKFLNPESIEKVRSYLTRIERATVNMDSLINDILSITKLEAGFLETEKELVGIHELLSEVIDLVSPIAHEKRIAINTDFKVATCETMCDRNQMFQVISNILGNAIKFTPEGGKISVELESCGPDAIKIAITDTGDGIHPDNLANVFDRFWQAHQTKRLGTGLGLAIVKGIIDNHGGRVWAESDGKTGTTFHFTIPMIRKIRKV